MVGKLNEKYVVLGLMSGTSLDGLDLALCSFSHAGNDWTYSIEKAETVRYSAEMGKFLELATHSSPEDLISNDHRYGKWLAEQCILFLKGEIQPHLIASHGHTIFHQPEKGFSFQLGNGNDISAITGLPVVYDFRSLDVALGGQGAPLVPVGDEHLFGRFDYCLNLGGFSNISYRSNGNRIAYDICPVNIALNDISKRMNESFDLNGELGRNGKLLKEIHHALNNLSFYKTSPPRSLSREWYEKNFIHLLNESERPQDLLMTLYEHITDQISVVINKGINKSILITGGGAKNTFMIERLKAKTNNHITIPDEITIDYKEALVFAFLGLLRYRNEINCYCSVTGARRNSSTGVITK